MEAAQAALDTSSLNLTFTKITAPISGRISRALVTEGNLVATGQTILTTLVSVDPIYVRFDGDEQAFLRYTKLAREGTRAAGGNPVMVGLADEAAIRTRAPWCLSTMSSTRPRAQSAAVQSSTTMTARSHPACLRE